MARNDGSIGDAAELSELETDVRLEHVVFELRMLRKEMEGYYSNLFRAQELLLTTWGDFFALWMEKVKNDRHS